MIAQVGTTGLAGQLIFFLYLLVPGYAAFRAYIWANVALDRTTRLTKLVLMAIGGFASLAGIALLRQTVLPNFVQMLSISNLISNFAITGELSVETISGLTILESTNLIISQSVVAIVGGVLVGMVRYVLIDQDNPRRKYLEQPWDELVDQVSRNDRITVVTCNGDQITGEFEQIGNNPEDKDLLIRGPQILGNERSEASNLGEISYHSHKDISRVIVYDQYLDGGRGWLNRHYMRVLQWLVNKEEAVSTWTMENYSKRRSRPYSKEDDSSNIDEKVQLGGSESEDEDGQDTE